MTATKCAHCGATLNPKAQWCSLCLTPVAAATPPEQAPGAASGAASGPGPVPLSQLPPPTTPPVIPGRDVPPPAAAGDEGRVAGATGVPPQRPGARAARKPDVDVDVDAMLAELAASESHRQPAWTSALRSRSNRYLFIAAVILVLIGAFLLVSLVVGRLFGD